MSSLVVAACGEYDYELGGLVSGGGASGSTGAQGGAAGRGGEGGLDASRPFSAPELVVELSDPAHHDDDPTLREDLLEIYFSSTRDGDASVGDIWRSERDSTNEPWEPPALAAELNSDGNETSVALAPDGRTIWVSSDRDGGPGGFDVWVAERSTVDEPWSELRLVSSINTDGDEIVRSSARSVEGLFLAWRDGSEAEYDLYFVKRDANGEYGARVAVEELNSEQNEADPFLAADDRVLYYTATRPDADDDLMVATREGSEAPFVLLRALDELNSDAVDSDAWVSPDQRFIMFASRRTDDQLDLYAARR